MGRKHGKKLLAITVCFAMIAAMISVSLSVSASAFSDWNNVDADGTVAAKSTVSYNGTVPSGKYLSKVVYNVTEGAINNTSKEIKVVYDNDGTYDYYFAYRFTNGWDRLFGGLGKSKDGSNEKQTSSDYTFTAVENITLGSSSLNSTSAQYQLSATTTGLNAQSGHTLTMEYTSATEVTFTVTDTAGISVSFKLTVNRAGVNFFDSANANKIKITPTVGITLGNISAEITDIPKEAFSEWDGIDSTGVATKNTAIEYNAYPDSSENKYLQKVKYEISGCPNNNTSLVIRLIYQTESDGTQYYFAYRFNGNMNTVYGGLGKIAGGTAAAQAASDYTVTGNENFNASNIKKLHSIDGSVPFSTAVFSKEAITLGHTAEIEYFSKDTVKFTIYATSAPDTKFSFTLKTNAGNPNFFSTDNRFSMMPTVSGVTFNEATATFSTVSAGAFTDWSGVDDYTGIAAADTDVTYTGTIPENEYLRSVRLEVVSMGFDAQKYMSLYYGYTDDSNNKRLSFRRGGIAGGYYLYASIFETKDGEDVKSDSGLSDSLWFSENTSSAIKRGYGQLSPSGFDSFNPDDGFVVTIDYLTDCLVKISFYDVDEANSVPYTVVLKDKASVYQTNGAMPFKLQTGTVVTFKAIDVTFGNDDSKAADAFIAENIETLAIDSTKAVAPYDAITVNTMLSKYGALSEAVKAELGTAVTTKITNLETAAAIWSKPDDDEAVASDFSAYCSSASDEEAWNVYNRLTAAQKKLVSEKYAELVAAMRAKTQVVDDTVNVYCVGDSLTYGSGSTDVDTYSYPKQLAGLLGGGYRVGKYGIAGIRVTDYNDPTRLNMANSTEWMQSHDGNADIVIIQLGTNDLLSVVNGMVSEEAYAAAFEKLVQSYLSLDNSPFVVISNTPVSYSGIEGGYYTKEEAKTVALINKQVADKYGLPCVDIHALTTGFDDDTLALWYNSDKLHFNDYGYSQVAKQFYDVITSFTTVFDTADVTAFTFTQTGVNGFLAPSVKSATIKARTLSEGQDIRYKSVMNVNTMTGYDIAEFGTIFAYYKTGMDLDGVLNLENTSTDVAVAKKTASDGSNLNDWAGKEFVANLGGISKANIGKAIVARSYVIYRSRTDANDTVVLYSNNSTDGSDWSKRKGTKDGYAVRSVPSIAKAMVSDIAVKQYKYGVEVSGDITKFGSYSSETETFTFNSDAINADNGESLLKFVKDNKSVIEMKI